MRQALDVEIRPLVDDDLPALAAALGRTSANYFRSKLLLQKAGKGSILAAFRKSWPVGAVFVLWGEPAQERQVRHEFPDVPLLYHVRVKESLRCRGIGTQLLAAAHDELRALGHKEVVLGVDVTNKDAIRLYERFGYDMVDRQSWGLGDSSYELMVLDLERNDRLEFLGSVTPRLDKAEERPSALSKRELASIIIELLGETSTTVRTAPTSPPRRRRRKRTTSRRQPVCETVKVPAAPAVVTKRSLKSIMVLGSMLTSAMSWLSR